jgi:hypothetical protein
VEEVRILPMAQAGVVEVAMEAALLVSVEVTAVAARQARGRVVAVKVGGALTAERVALEVEAVGTSPMVLAAEVVAAMEEGAMAAVVKKAAVARWAAEGSAASTQTSKSLQSGR